METPNDPNLTAKFIPLACGVLSAAFLTVYTFQRAGKLGATLDAGAAHLLGAAAAAISLIGAILYFALPKHYRKSKLFIAGVILNFLTSVWGFALLRA